MIRRTLILVGIILLLSPAAAALAGGWVVVTLETMPEQIRAHEQVTVTFMVRQHGQTPTHDVSPLLLATHRETGRQIEIRAEAARKKGLFSAELNLPEPGVWEWSIQTPPFNQTATFAPLTVLLAQQGAGPAQTGQAELAWQAPARWAGLALLATAAVLFAVSRRRGRGVASPAPRS